MKKNFFPLLLVLVTVIFLTSCGGLLNSSDSPKSVTLTIMGKNSDLEKIYMKRIFDEYKEVTGNKLEIISIEDSDFEKTALQKFENGDAPDILLHFHNADLSRFDVSNQFYYLNNETWVGDLTESALAYCQDKEGNLLGLPFWESSVSGCYYNKTLLNSMGMNPASTQAEFDVLCQVLSEIGCTPICWPANGCTWMFQFGLDPIFADNPSLLDQLNKNEITYSDIPAVTDMVQWIADASKKGWFGSNYLKHGWNDISSELSSGKTVMTFIWDTWFYTDFKADGKYSVDDFALMPIFMNTADSGTYEGGNLNMMMANKDSKHLDAVLEFFTFCASPENYNTAFDGIPTVSCFKGQNTNIQSQMVSEAQSSIKANERVSTAATRIIGYNAEDVAAAFDSLFRGKTDVAGCIKLMDEYRIEKARMEGTEDFIEK